MSLEHSLTRTHKTAGVPSSPDDDEVMTLAEWRATNNLKPRTAARILAGPKDQRPVLTQLSERRYGITRRNNRLWQQSRAR